MKLTKARSARRFSVIVVEEQPFARFGLGYLLKACPGINVVAETVASDEARELASKLKPDVIVVGIRSNANREFYWVRDIREKMPEIKVFVLIDSTENSAMLGELESLVHGLMLKTERTDKICEAIASVAHGEKIIETKAGTPSDSIRTKGLLLECLSNTENIVVKLVAEGCTNKDIAAELNISANTVRSYLNIAMGKLGVKKRAQVAVLYERYQHENRNGVS